MWIEIHLKISTLNPIIMKIKFIIAIFLLAYIFEILGVHFKIMHLMGAPQLYTTASILKVLALILGVWKVLTTKTFSSFLDA